MNDVRIIAVSGDKTATKKRLAARMVDHLLPSLSSIKIKSET